MIKTILAGVLVFLAIATGRVAKRFDEFVSLKSK